MVDLETLASIEEIKQLKAQYFRFADAGDLASYERLFTADAKIDVRGALGPGDGAETQATSSFDDGALIVGGAAFVEFISRVSVPGTVSVHHGHMPEIEILSPTQARGVWAMEDRVWFPAGTPHRLMHGFGHYHETYERRDGRWLISSMRLVRLKVEMT